MVQEFQCFIYVGASLFCHILYEDCSLFPTRMLGTFWKLARIGERKSQYVAACCIFMAMSVLFWS